MRKLRLDQDIRPLSEFRSEVASSLKRVNDTGRPLVITQRGRGVAVVVDVREFEIMRERLELLEDLYVADRQLQEGAGVGHKAAKAKVIKRLSK